MLQVGLSLQASLLAGKVGTGTIALPKRGPALNTELGTLDCTHIHARKKQRAICT